MFQFLCVLLVTKFGLVYPGFTLHNKQVSLVEQMDMESVTLEDLINHSSDLGARLGVRTSVDENIEAAMLRNTESLETHYVETDDGYILTIHRLVDSQSRRNVQNKPVVFLQHGLLSCSLHFTTQGPGKALAYLLVDQGYDVWMGNSRGNMFSKNHVTLNPNLNEFWTFSWNEMGYFDLPAMIDYILNITNQTALNYVGHSQGTTSFLVMASTRPEYNTKIKAMHALSPIAFMSHIGNPLFRILGPYVGQAGSLTNYIGGFEFLPYNNFTRTLGKILCGDEIKIEAVCSNIIFLVVGYSPENMNASLLPELLQTFPAGGSINQLIHYGQSIGTGEFRMFDFDLIGNLMRYGSIIPPEYNLTKVTSPVHLHYAANDLLAALEDVAILANRLPNVVFSKRVPHPTFNHIDFLLGIYAYDLVYKDLIDNIKKFT